MWGGRYVEAVGAVFAPVFSGLGGSHLLAVFLAAVDEEFPGWGQQYIAGLVSPVFKYTDYSTIDQITYRGLSKRKGNTRPKH